MGFLDLRFLHSLTPFCYNKTMYHQHAKYLAEGLHITLPKSEWHRINQLVEQGLNGWSLASATMGAAADEKEELEKRRLLEGARHSYTVIDQISETLDAMLGDIDNKIDDNREERAALDLKIQELERQRAVARGEVTDIERAQALEKDCATHKVNEGSILEQRRRAMQDMMRAIDPGDAAAAAEKLRDIDTRLAELRDRMQLDQGRLDQLIERLKARGVSTDDLEAHKQRVSAFVETLDEKIAKLKAQGRELDTEYTNLVDTRQKVELAQRRLDSPEVQAQIKAGTFRHEDLWQGAPPHVVNQYYQTEATIAAASHLKDNATDAGVQQAASGFWDSITETAGSVWDGTVSYVSSGIESLELSKIWGSATGPEPAMALAQNDVNQTVKPDAGPAMKV